MMTNQDELSKEFILACDKAKGQYLTRMGYQDCLLKSKPSLVITLSTGSPTVKVETGNSHVEMYNVKSISSVTVPNRMKILNNKGNIFHVRPEVGLVTFNGDVQGALLG